MQPGVLGISDLFFMVSRFLPLRNTKFTKSRNSTCILKNLGL